MTRHRGVAELLLFVGASGIGIYAFGRGTAGFFGNPHADPLWLPVGFAALWVLAKQMGRIQDKWPRRRQARRPAAAGGRPPAPSRANSMVPGCPPTANGSSPLTSDARSTTSGSPAASPHRRST